MKIIWSPDKKSIIVVAETAAERAVAQLFLADSQHHEYATLSKGSKVTGAKFSVMPEESKE